MTPDYMVGRDGVGVETVAERIAAFAPDAKLIALLRNPVERAVSAYMMAVRRGQEKRSLDTVPRDQPAPGELVGARRGSPPPRTYVTGGEYGRILSAYCDRFDAQRLLVAYSKNLEADAGAVLDAMLVFLGLPPGFRPEGLERRHFRGDTRRLLDDEAEAQLRGFFEAELPPRMEGTEKRHRSAFEFFLETWNVAPAERPPPLAETTRARLEAHLRDDAGRLAELGSEAPWLAAWNGQTGV